ncbi:MAG: coenzyme A biosynthesis bifunctional protein CoaBC [marine bacterium B5-7]|nr:MAG: coenzyme A biosynthesis bifunctional protein CoaBC [marine bacterium B5-7]
MQNLTNKNVLLGVTGGIAAYKAAELSRRLSDAGARVRVVMTEAATAFISPLTMQAVSGHPVRTRLLDSDAESGMDHIELARWANAIVIAPATADFIARLTQGSADDLLTTLCLASEAPVLLAPAMNRIMWSKPVTQRNLAQLIADGIKTIGPGEGSQACGETGPGRMSEASDIVAALEVQLAAKHDPRVAGRHVLITAGPTFEAIDPVRGITNHSSGKMGYALVEAFIEAGSLVTLISGPTHLPRPGGAQRIDVTSACDMQAAVNEHIASQDIFIGVAAVADYRPENLGAHKLKKGAERMTLTMVRNPDILAEVAARDNRPFCVGFAAETRDVENYARAKLHSKRLDLICANQVGGDSGGFNNDFNTLLVLSGDDAVTVGPADKRIVAESVCHIIAEHYDKKHPDKNTRPTT